MNQQWTAENLQGHGIRFNDYIFTEPERLTEWSSPRFAGVFVILVQDPNWAPKPFQPLWFGEFGNNAQHLFAAERTPHTGSLFVSVLPMLFSTTEQRCSVRDRLVWAYNPILQTKRTPLLPSEWAYKLHELEKKHEEHTSELRTLLTASNPKVVEAQPGRRRRIGFLPDPEPTV
jgi:hypothetical protein